MAEHRRDVVAKQAAEAQSEHNALLPNIYRPSKEQKYSVRNNLTNNFETSNMNGTLEI